MTSAIAIVGMACEYPDARSPHDLWENVLAQRRAFRQIPPERLRRDDYFSADRSAPDRTYATEAALIEGYEFDRHRFRVVGSTFRSADLAHWLALDVASRALADAGFPDGEGLPRETTGVIVGNTLTGDSSRANGLRLRWPYVQRTVDALLAEHGQTAEERDRLLRELEARYKSPFAPVGEETLAGGLSNTIAGRICNHFDLQGGGYAVDGACASSLLAAATACAALADGDLDVALAGGVDLSIDPFEVVGFAKAGALAVDEMRVYDVRSAGFWPGEGCGMLVLMRLADAITQQCRVYACVRGWGISSDGQGGITRPEADGQILAIQRAYRRAGIDVGSVAYFEGHGTGTDVGDDTELRVLARARREAGGGQGPATIGSVKANVGHTKAAAGVAGIIKATLAIQHQVLPPTTGCDQPHPELIGPERALRVLNQGEPWPTDQPLRAGVSAMGFGGINTHLVLEGISAKRRSVLNPREQSLSASVQDAEVMLLSAKDIDGLSRQIEHLTRLAPRLSRSELADLAAQLETQLDGGPIRAACVVATPRQFAQDLKQLKDWLTAGDEKRLDVANGVFLNRAAGRSRLGFLFPGQGSPVPRDGGALGRRFPSLVHFHAPDPLLPVDESVDPRVVSTAFAQPAIVAASLGGLRLLERLGVIADVAIGHSLGELTALYWAGVFDNDTLLQIALARGQAMAELTGPAGTMAAIFAGPFTVEALLATRHPDDVVGIAGLNGPSQTVIAGEQAAIASLVAEARRQGLRARDLPVSHGFHSPLMAPVTPVLAAALRGTTLHSLQRTVVSTVSGRPLRAADDLRAILCRQLTTPVRFAEAVAQAAPLADLFIEVGSGQILAGLLTECENTPAVSLDCGGSSLKGLLNTVGAVYVLGASLDHHTLFADRFTRPFDLEREPHFFTSPCELAPVLPSQPGSIREIGKDEPVASAVDEVAMPGEPSATSTIELVRQLVANRTELPPSLVRDNDRLLSDLHLNSITVGELVVKATQSLGLPAPVAPTDFADATISAVAQAIEEIKRTGVTRSSDDRTPSGVDAWVRAFTVELVERPLPSRRVPAGEGQWRVFAPPSHWLSQSLQEAFATGRHGAGTIVCLPPNPAEESLGLLLAAAREVLNGNQPERFVLVQHGRGAASFARTLYQEAPQLTVIVVDVPVDEPRAAEWVLAEVAGAVGYSEAYYDSTGRRREAVLRLLPLVEPSSLPLSSDDVLLVTGGGKGIAAECALTLARETGARLLLIGRAKPADDSELAANLARLSSYGITYHYVSADVVDTEAVRTALQTGQTILGPVSGFLHGAGTNEPRLLRSLDEAAFARTLAPKLHGVRHVLDALDPDRLRLFVTFGSIIARTGLPGEADYAVANEWLTGVAEDFAAAHPRCRCLAIEWSVWSGVGMGQRLGRVDTLAHAGISPIPPERGVAILRQLIGQATSTVALVVTGRYGDVPTLKREQRNLPFQRFLENPRVYYPGVELVVDVELSRDSDPYLADHVFQGERLLPAVIGIEAMAQVAMALAGVDTPPVFTNVEFCRPVVVVDSDPVIARIAALKREDGRVDVVVRCEKTDFQVDHLRATCRFDDRCASDSPCLEAAPLSDGNSTTSAPLDDALQPSRDLYGKILFHGERFRRLRGYRRLTATQCVVEIVSDSEATWFGKYLPTDLVLGDPAVRDAAIHAIQACIPHATVLPVGVDRLLTTVLPTTGSLTAQAHERWRNGDTFCYDLEIIGDDGVPRERWEGLRLRQVGAASLPETWPIPLLRPYLERRLGELVASSRITVVLESAERRSDTTETDGVICRAVGRPVTIHRRPDGKPELMEGDTVSVAHSENLTLVVAGAQPLGCDLEIIVERPSVLWQDLLGISRYALAQRIAREVGESQGTAATRVWAAGEALKKGGAMPDVPIAMSEATSDGWVVLAAGAWRVPTVRLSLRANQDSRVLAFAIADAGRQKTPKRVEPSQFCPRAGDEIARRFGRFWDSPKAIPPSLI